MGIAKNVQQILIRFGVHTERYEIPFRFRWFSHKCLVPISRENSFCILVEKIHQVSKSSDCHSKWGARYQIRIVRTQAVYPSTFDESINPRYTTVKYTNQISNFFFWKYYRNVTQHTVAINVNCNRKKKNIYKIVIPSGWTLLSWARFPFYFNDSINEF